MKNEKGELMIDLRHGDCLEVMKDIPDVACINTNRNFIGIELDENYFNTAKERIEQAKRLVY